MATSGKKHWPPMGRTQWPLTSTDVQGLCDRWLTDLDFMAEEVPHGVYTHTFHPQSIGRAGRIKLLERVIHRAKEHSASFVTASEAVDAWKQGAPAKG